MRKVLCIQKAALMMSGAAVLLMACAAFAQGDSSQPLWGWNPALLSTVLGVLAPFATSLLAKADWSPAAKRWLVAGVSGVATVGVGVLTRSVTQADLAPETIFVTLTTVFSVATVTYQLFSRSFGNLTAKIDDKKKI